MHLALFDNLNEISKFLIQMGAEINEKDNLGVTPLHVASLKGNIEIAELLLEKGADVNIIANNGSTPLFSAIKNKLRSTCGRDMLIQSLSADCHPPSR